MSQTTANNTMRPIEGMAWPMLNTAIAGGVMERANGRVSRMPIGMAIASTSAVETTVNSICSQVALRMASELRRFASPELNSLPWT